MELSYEMQGTNTYLVYTVPQDTQLDMISMGMLVNNRIPGLAQTIFTQLDSARYVKYNVSAKVPSEQLFMSPISRRRFLGVIGGIVSAMLSAEEYMLEPGSILLDLGHMYSDIKTGETVLICVPIEDGVDAPADLKGFIKKIMYDTSFDQNENCDYITKIINYLNGSAALSLADFQEFLRSLAVEKPAAAARPEPPRPQEAAPVRSQQSPEVQRPPVQPAEPLRVPSPAPAPAPVPVPGGQSFSVPPASVPAAAEEETGPGEKSISLMYLLRNYSKENLAAYKAQQGKGAKKEKKAPKKSRKGGESQAQPGFVVPGMEMPGAQSPAPQPVPAPEPVRQPAPVSAPAPQPAPAGLFPPPTTAPLGPAQVVASVRQSFGETDYFPEEGGRDETVILGMEQSAQQVVIPFLVRRKNNERIPVDKPLFRLGRDVDFNDYAILDNRYVGHSHCHLLQQDGEYFILDDNSKNHTKVNGTIIPPGQPVKIAHGYVISVADEEFEFRLY